MVLTERNNSPAASLLDLPAATRSATARSCGGQVGDSLLRPREVQPARAEFALAALDVSSGAQRVIQLAGGAEDDVGLCAFPRPAESLAVGKIDSGSVVGERQRLDAE